LSATRTQRLLDWQFTTDEMRAVFSDHGRLQGMLDFEAALARAEAESGAIPQSAAPAIAASCRAEALDVEALAAASATAGNPAIPLVQQLTELVAAKDPEAARYVHWGATSQDAMDTGLVLQLRSALGFVARDLDRLSGALATLARTYAATPLAGRTWLRQGPPVTLGLKTAGWLSAIDRHRVRLAEIRPRMLVLQFGGAVGTLAALGTHAPATAAALARDIGLALPELPWHSQRDRVAEVATTLGLVVGTLGKIARDVSLLMQTEVGEAAEPAAPGRGGSSTMPHKKNPVASAVMLSAATRVPALVATMLSAMVQEHERGLGGWHAEWETLPEICRLTAGSLAHAIAIIDGLDIDASRMTANLEATRGLILAEAVSIALGPHLGRLAAHELIERACAQAVRERKGLRQVLATDQRVMAHLSLADLDRLLDPRHYTGQAQAFVARVLATREGKGHGAAGR
jgi:3-carboxy-cis,cis-muconate cycloisomerase